MPFCSKCGSEIEGADKYCNSCGQAAVNSSGHAIEIPSRKRMPAKYICLLLGMVIGLVVGSCDRSRSTFALAFLPIPFGLGGFAVGAIIDQLQSRT